MAKVNRPTIGTVHCEHCGGTRSLHQYEGGRHDGKIYTRCVSCPETANKFISKTSKVEQRFLRSKATFKPEFAHLAVTAEEPATPNTPKPSERSEVKAKDEPQNTPTGDPKPQPTPTHKGKGRFGLVAAFVTGAALIAIGAMSQ